MFAGEARSSGDKARPIDPTDSKACQIDKTRYMKSEYWKFSIKKKKRGDTITQNLNKSKNHQPFPRHGGFADRCFA